MKFTKQISLCVTATLTFAITLTGIEAPAASAATAESVTIQGTGAPYSGTTLDYGIYWYGIDNVSQKAVPGVYNPYFSPSKPTVIYVHGWQNGSTPQLKRESFNYKQNDATYGVDVDTADAWIRAGWNIGIFYWNQFADEGEVTDAEAKIWTASGPKQMRWRKVDGTYSSGPAKSAGELFYDSYVSTMQGYTGNNVRIAGHSLGNQMATRLTKLVSDKVSAGQLPANLRPKRVALLDPFWSKYGKDYLGGKWTGEVSRQYVTELKTKGVVFEHYKSSGITDVGIGDANLDMEKLTAFSNMAPWYIPSTNLAAKHVAAPNEYFYSFYTAPPEEVTISWGTRSQTGKVAASAATSDARIKEMMDPTKYWVQVEGRYTQDPADDMYEVKSR